MIVWLGVWGGDGGSQVGQHPRLLAHCRGKCADVRINTQGRAHWPHAHGQIYKNDWFDDHQAYIIDEFEENARHYEGYYSHFNAPIKELRLYISFTGKRSWIFFFLHRKDDKSQKKSLSISNSFCKDFLYVFFNLIKQNAQEHELYLNCSLLTCTLHQTLAALSILGV